MSKNHIDNRLLHFILFSIILHAAIIVMAISIPHKNKEAEPEPYMVELQDVPELLEKPGKADATVSRRDVVKRRVLREKAPKGEMAIERPSFPQRPPQTQRMPDTRKEVAALPKTSEPGDVPMKEKNYGAADFFKPKVPVAPKIFPTYEKLARMEEIYRKKYGPEIEEGETKFLNSDDFQFGSFLRRFETAVYGVWRYPAEAARSGIEGVTPVRIVFNRQGEITKVDLLESSGSKLLDNEVIRTLRQVGPVGTFPRGYEKETFNLIAFFYYGISRGISRGTLR